MKRELNLCNLYILLWLIMFFQNLLGAGSFASLVVFFPSMLITIYCGVMLVMHHDIKGPIAIWLFFSVFLLLYGFWAILFDGNTSFFTMVFSSMGPVIAFYYFTLKRLLKEKHLIFWLFVFIITTTISYYDNQTKRMELLLNNRFESITNNVSYYFVGLLPFVFLLKKKPFIQYVTLAYLLYFIINGMKRGAMLAALLLLIWFIYISISKVKGLRREFVVFLTVITIIIGWTYIMRFYNANDYFQYRIESAVEGSSSGRDIIYSTLWNHFIGETSIFKLLFGGGAYYTTAVTARGNVAHNDWLELLIDCGLVGAFIYLIYWIKFLHEWLKSKKDILCYSILGSCFLFTFFRTLISMNFSDTPFHVSMILGYYFAYNSLIKNGTGILEDV